MVRERDILIENLSTLLASGMDLLLALRSIQTEIKTAKMKRILSQLIEQIDEGIPLSKALSSLNLFAPYMISLIRIGEQSGRLAEQVAALAAQIQKDKLFVSRVRSAMMYPLFVLALSFIIAILIAWFVLPRLSDVFGSLSVELPLITRVILQTGDFLQKWGVLFLPASLFMAFLAIYFLFFFPKTKKMGEGFLFSLPGCKKLLQELELARMGHLFSMVLNAGIPITESLQALAQITPWQRFRIFYTYLSSSIEEGNSLAKSFTAFRTVQHLLPVTVQQMIIAAERSGRLVQVLERIGQEYEQKSDITTKNISILLEPLLLFIVWLCVLFLAIAVILPIYSLIGGFQVQ